MKVVVFFILFIFFSGPVFGQSAYSTKSKKAVKHYEEAQLLLKQRRINEAIKELNNALEKDNNFIEAHLRLAFSYELIREINAQQYHLEQIVKIDPNTGKYRNVYYSLGKIYFNKGLYEKSREQLDRLDAFGIDNKRIREDVTRLNENLEFALQNIQRPIDIAPKPMPDILNSFPLQYFPVLTADGNTIIYTVRLGVKFHDDENIVISEKDEQGNWGKPISISPNINSQFNEGTCTISADGRTLIFTTCEGRKSYGSCDLYISEKTGDEWSAPVNLGKNVNSRSWDSQPALSADGRKLFFVSDRGGGYGKRDIWLSVKDGNNIWQKAVNLGPAVNTKEDEVSPFIHVNGTTLFFASRGFPGFGGFDLYKSELFDTVWQEPENLGYPLNTHEDQVSLFVSTNGKNGYYSFERKWQTDESQSFLYEFEFPASGILENRSIYLTGNIYDEETGKPLDANIELYNLGDDRPVAIFTSDPVSGKYFSILNEKGNIVLYIDREGYLFQSQSFVVDVEQGNFIAKDIYLKPIKKGSKVRLNNIFFEFNSAKLTEESKTELYKIVGFLVDNPSTKITISGHTDDQGTEDYNMKLSEKRAKAVYDFLINEGINPEFLTYIGFGESQPLISKTDEESRKMNRRIEFSVDEL
ncbi:MAG: OmpA family protein [Cytophagales bacterium]|nr:OmpA family protein [Cytophagales bacterium]